MTKDDIIEEYATTLKSWVGLALSKEECVSLMSAVTNEALSLGTVSQQRELLKKWWKYIDKESVAVNCNEQEREEVINDFFKGSQLVNVGCKVCGRTEVELSEMTSICTVSICPR
jgi:hypothetical protein